MRTSKQCSVELSLEGNPYFLILLPSHMVFRLGELYSSKEIQDHLQVGNAGGIRISLKNKIVQRIVILTAAPTAKIERENPYHDRVEGNVLVYSAGGLQGDQSLGGVNKRIVEQKMHFFPIYGFRLNEHRRKAGVKRWEFIGLLQFLRVYPDSQIDKNGTVRKVWLFEFRICSEVSVLNLDNERSGMAQAINSYVFDADSEARASMDKPDEPVASIQQDAEAVERARASIFSLEPRQFELLIKSALIASGFENVEVTRFTQDNGIDVNARVAKSCWPMVGHHVQIQAKRWLHTVGRREVAELRGSLAPFASGAVVTTSFFSKAAISEASVTGRQPIVLVDGYHFAKIANDLKLVAS